MMTFDNIKDGCIGRRLNSMSVFYTLCQKTGGAENAGDAKAKQKTTSEATNV